MKIPLSWLKDFVDITIPPRELAHRLTMAGVEVAGVTTMGGTRGKETAMSLRQILRPKR